MVECSILNFDSELFGFKVAKIFTPQLNILELQTLLMQLGTQDVRLVYWPSDSTDQASQEAAQRMQGFLGSQQVTYALDLQDLPSNLSLPNDVEFYSSPDKHNDEHNLDLENLAIYAGGYSHFKMDPKFPYNLFLKLYMTWMANSIKGKAADVVIITQRNKKITGMITAGKKNGYGDIGLLAVYPEYRGQNFGSHLIQAAQLYWRNIGLAKGKVMTQIANKSACNLYEKCGFKIEKIDNFYHFWL